MNSDYFRQNMPKLSETFVTRLPNAKAGTEKYWDAEIKGLVLFVVKRSKTWCFQKDVGGQTKSILIDRFQPPEVVVVRACF